MKFGVLGMKIGAVAVLAACLMQATTEARATILVDQISTYGGHYVGGSDMNLFTQALANQPGGYKIGTVANTADVQAASAILIVTRDNNFGINKSLSATEIANLTSFMATGGRVVIMGEGFFWDEWNNSVLSFASGGTASSGTVVSGNATPVVSNSLTDGVGSILVAGCRNDQRRNGTVQPEFCDALGTQSPHCIGLPGIPGFRSGTIPR